MAVDLSLTPGQLGEIWQAATVEEGIELLRHISAGDAADDAEAGGPPAPAEEILLEFLLGSYRHHYYLFRKVPHPKPGSSGLRLQPKQR